MISEKNINKKIMQNDFLGVVVKYVVVQFLQKRLVLSRNFYCVSLVFIFPDLVWCWWHIIKQIFYTFFRLILELFTLGKIIFNSASRR